MSYIEEKEKQLYKKDSQTQMDFTQEDALNPKNIDIKKTSYRGWQNPSSFGLSKKTKKIIYFVVGFFVLATFALLGLNKYLEYTSWSIDKIEMTLDGPANLTSGSYARWILVITNRNTSALEDVELFFDYPEGSYIATEGFIKEQKATQLRINLGDIFPGKSIQKDFNARIVAPENSLRSATATINFKPKGISKEIKKSVKFTTSISNFPIILKIEAPRQIFSNKEIFYKINYINSSENAFNNLRIKVQYPPGFIYSESDPLPSEEKNIWQIDKLGPTQEGQIKIKGIITGQENDFKTILAMIEGLEGEEYVIYTKQTSQTEIISSPLALKIKVNGEDNPSVYAGQELQYNIIFENNFDAPLQDLYLSAKLDGTMFNLSTLRTNGYFDVYTNTITWGPREIPQLKVLNPKESGSASFKINLKNFFPILNPYKDKEFFVKVSFNIGTRSVPQLIGLKEINYSTDVINKINTQVFLRVQAFYRENFTSIQNFGPIPPQVGQTTTFTLHWQIINVSNDIDDVVISATLPTGVVWTNNYYANFSKEGITYDESLKRVTWKVGKVPATTGIANGLPVYQAVFQVAITPGPHQINKPVDLLDKTTLTAKDTFTGINIEVSGLKQSTSTLEDQNIDSRQGLVKP